MKAARFLASVVGQAHARQMDAPAKRNGGRRCKIIEPGSWTRLPGYGQALSSCRSATKGNTSNIVGSTQWIQGCKNVFHCNPDILWRLKISIRFVTAFS